MHQQTKVASIQVGAGIHFFIERRLVVLESLKSYFETQPGISESQFQSLAAELIKDTPDIRSLQWINPKLVVTWVYPLKGNEAAVGHDLNTAPKALPFVRKALRQKRVSVNDPYELKQGGLGVIARTPIYPENRPFGGLNAAVLDVPAIVDDAINPEILREYHISLSDSKGNLFWSSDGKHNPAHRVSSSEKIRVGDNFWRLDVHLMRTTAYALAPVRIGLWSLSVLIMLVMVMWLRNTSLQAINLEQGVAQRTRKLQQINKVASLLSRSSENEPMLQGALQELIDALGFSSGACLLIPPRQKSLLLRAEVNCPTELLAAITDIPVGTGFIGSAVPEGAPHIITSVTPVSDEEGRILSLADARGAIVWPLRARNNRISGVIVLFDSSGKELTPEEIDLIDTITSQIGLAQENIRNADYQRDISTALQKDLIAGIANISGLEVGASYTSATPEAAVGGDFYDVFPLGAGRVIFSIGDVSGKGVAAATTGAMIRNAVRTLGMEGLDPVSLLERLASTAESHGVSANGFVTMFYGVLDMNANVLTFICAGHPCPLMIRPGGEDRALACEHGLPIGVALKADYVTSEIDMHPGDTLVMFTDGLLEARNGDGELYGEKRAAILAARFSDESPELIVKALHNDSARFAGDMLSDDIAIVAIRRLANS